MLKISNSYEFDRLLLDCRELDYIIKALLKIASNEFFFGEFLWDSPSSLTSLLETYKLLKDIGNYNCQLNCSWQRLSSLITHDTEYVGNIMDIIFSFLDPVLDLSMEISAITKEYQLFLYDTGQYL